MTAHASRRSGAPARGLPAPRWVALASRRWRRPLPCRRATTYKWVDDKGVVHYTDKIPPEAVNKGSVELDKQAVRSRRSTLRSPRSSGARATPRRSAAAQQAKSNEETARRDRALLVVLHHRGRDRPRAHPGAGDHRRAAPVGAAYTASCASARTSSAREGGGTATSRCRRRSSASCQAIDTELAKQSDLIASKKQAERRSTARYDADKQRWRELTAAKAAADGGRGSAGGASHRRPTGVAPTGGR